MNHSPIEFYSNFSTWQKTLPSIIEPFENESLYGYLLRLDKANNFTPGTIVDMIKRLNTGRLSLNRPGLFVIGTIFDINKLSELVDIDNNKLQSLTLLPLMRNILRIEEPYPDLAGYSPFFKVCPLCIRDFKMPLIHMFRNVTMCIEHQILLQYKCTCGSNIKLFTSSTKFFYCLKCNLAYSNLPLVRVLDKSVNDEQKYFSDGYINLLNKNLSLINQNEDLYTGLERRFQYFAFQRGIGGIEFKNLFGFDASNIKNGHGTDNISVARIMEILYKLGYTIDEFRAIRPNVSVEKIRNLTYDINSNNTEHTCPNIYCENFNLKGKSNIKLYGRKRQPSGEIAIEEYCSTCGTRFFGNNIIQSYDYNPGLRNYKIENARLRIQMWQNALQNVCQEFLEKRIPITLTGTFKKASIPIGKTYFIERLGLVSILEKYADIQRRTINNLKNDMNEIDSKAFLRRIYKKRKQ